MTNPKKDIVISNQITLLIEAINCDNQETARLLVRRALNVVYDNKKSQWSLMIKLISRLTVANSMQ